MEGRRGRPCSRNSIDAWTARFTLAGWSGEGALWRTKQVVAGWVRDERPIGAVIGAGSKHRGQARCSKDGVGMVTVVVIRDATGVADLAFAVRVLTATKVLVVMRMVTKMLHHGRSLLVREIRRQYSGSPLQRQKQHQEGDHEIAHGDDCRLSRLCRHFAHAAAAGRTHFDQCIGGAPKLVHGHAKLSTGRALDLPLQRADHVNYRSRVHPCARSSGVMPTSSWSTASIWELQHNQTKKTSAPPP